MLYLNGMTLTYSPFHFPIFQKKDKKEKKEKRKKKKKDKSSSKSVKKRASAGSPDPGICDISLNNYPCTLK